MTRAIAVVALVLVACASPRATKHAAHCTSIDDERCAELIAPTLRLLLSDRYEDLAVSRYVEGIVARLARATGDKRSWEVVILDDDGTNAFVALGSTIYLLRGMLAVLRSEAELAAVLAHEMGHLRGGHTRENWSELLRKAPRAAADQLLDNRYARDDEIQADEHAVLLLEKAGYDPHAVTTTMRALGGTHMIDGDAADATDATDATEPVHPPSLERIARVQALVSLRPKQGGDLGETRYRAGLATLQANNDPRKDPVLIDKAVVFAQAKVAIDLPPHEIFPNGLSRVMARLPDGALAEFVTIPTRSKWRFDKWVEAGPSDEFAFESEVVGTQILLYSVSGRNAKAHIRDLRSRRRVARPDEVAQVRPTFVDLNAPRRLWTP